MRGLMKMLLALFSHIIQQGFIILKFSMIDMK